MKKADIREILLKATEARQEVVIKRDKIDSAALYGIPLILDHNMVLIQYVYDYEFDGYMILRIKDITSVRSGELERFSEYILKQEGLYDQIKMPMLTTLHNWKTILEEIKIQYNNILVESEDIEDGEIYIGKIQGLNNYSLEILCFDAMGRWNKEAVTIPYKKITAVRLEDRYTTVISKYVQQPVLNDVSPKE